MLTLGNQAHRNRNTQANLKVSRGGGALTDQSISCRDSQIIEYPNNSPPPLPSIENDRPLSEVSEGYFKMHINIVIDEAHFN